ncbi:MAG TPA: hypothetical protein VMY41_20355 [Thermohalobaculum sp.]|nr:hypothetical protein [Thermohalobaculum sp.]
MTMTAITKITRLARNLAIGALAIGATSLMLPGTAAAASYAHTVAQRLDRIAYEVSHVQVIRNPYRKNVAINHLQKRLYRLEKINWDQRGRRMRVNAERIDRLQHRLQRIERRASYRPEQGQGRRHDNQRGGWSWSDQKR